MLTKGSTGVKVRASVLTAPARVWQLAALVAVLQRNLAACRVENRRPLAHVIEATQRTHESVSF